MTAAAAALAPEDRLAVRRVARQWRLVAGGRAQECNDAPDFVGVEAFFEPVHLRARNTVGDGPKQIRILIAHAEEPRSQIGGAPGSSALSMAVRAARLK